MSRTAKSKTLDGVTYVVTHSGQKKAYGDTFTEYDVTSDLPADDVERICATKIHPSMPEAVWLAEYRDTPKGQSSADRYFRAHYKFRRTGEGRYFFSVCFPYTD